MLGFDLPGHRRRWFLITFGGVLGSALSVVALPLGGSGPALPAAAAAVSPTTAPAPGPAASTGAPAVVAAVVASPTAIPTTTIPKPALSAGDPVPPTVPASEVAGIVSAALATAGPGVTTGPTTTPAPAPTAAPATTAAAPTVTTISVPSPTPRPAATPVPGPSTSASAPAPVPGAGSGSGTAAAVRYGWGNPVRADDFTSGLGPDWGVYNGAGHDGKGRRSPGAVSVSDGVMTITGSPDGTTGGMAWGQGQKYGRWEARVAAPASDPSYNAVALLWPDAENWPVGGEVDFMEMSDPGRQSTDMFLHYGADNSQVSSTVRVDATTWHNWAVEWTPEHIIGYVDGVEWFRTTDTAKLPPGPMHLCLQLDWFPEGGAVRTSSMSVDWVRQYR